MSLLSGHILARDGGESSKSFGVASEKSPSVTVTDRFFSNFTIDNWQIDDRIGQAIAKILSP
jgi:hypothetical protein